MSSTAASTTTFIDPKVFRADSVLGVPGLMDVYRAGRVALANAPGTGIADDKAVYAYVPRDHQVTTWAKTPILPNVPTYSVRRADRPRIRARAPATKLVVKPANESGGYGMLIGPQATTRSSEPTIADLIRTNPRNYIAQPMLDAVHGADGHRRPARRPPRRPAAVHLCTAKTSTSCPAA